MDIVNLSLEAYPLACMFEMFFSTAFVPPAWKMAYIKPIFKMEMLLMPLITGQFLSLVCALKL